MKITVLGCGGSGGVPLANGTPGGDWGACNPEEPKNRRRRVSVLVEEGDTTLLIDATPDLRVQIIDNDIDRLNAVLLTHAHADHCHGLDELRGMVHRQGNSIDTFMDRKTQEALTLRFGYIFASSANPKSLYRPLLQDHVIDGNFRVGPFEVIAFEQNHGPEISLGFRIGPFAYSTDAKMLDDAAFATLEGVKLWIVDCLRDRPHPTHSHVAQTFEWIERLKPERAILTHLNQDVDYQDLKDRCPPGVEPGYDGMVLELPLT